MKKMMLKSVLGAFFLLLVTTLSSPAAVPASPQDAKEIIQEILDAVGVKAKFEVRAAKIPNAAAAISKGKRYILYNPAFIAAIDKATGSNRWGPISILAHEIGHHLNGHTLLGTGSKPSIELEADEFSGFVLRKMGASLEDAQLAMRLIASRRASTTHPARHDRLVAIAAGWEKADGQLANRSNLAKKGPARTQPQPARVRTQTVPPAVLDERYIAYDVHFTADPGSRYHVTIRNNLVKLAGNKLAVLGKLLPTNSSTYPMALRTNANTVFLVSRKGQIVTSSGKALGYVEAR
ncbi:MAG TPA: hypothetical protein VD996_07605 [Chitinophagaceae bacterium]|nr:hypothetical protein [Chitinophagaceae bacterium]